MAESDFLKVGLTGSIGSGKSEVRKGLEQLGAFTMDADRIGYIKTLPGTEAFEKIVNLWGQDIVLSDGELNRRKLAEVVFRDDKETKKLEEILHPLIIAEENRMIENIMKTANGGIIVIEAALMIETGSWKRFDKMVVVTAGRDVRFERLHNARSLDGELFDLLSARQLEDEEKLKQADYHIENDGTLDELSEKILWLSYKLKNDVKEKQR